MLEISTLIILLRYSIILSSRYPFLKTSYKTIIIRLFRESVGDALRANYRLLTDRQEDENGNTSEKGKEIMILL